MGSACLYFDIKPSRAILSDVNADLVEAFRATKCRVHQLYGSLASMPSSEQTYYSIRSQDPRSLSFVERAARFTYLNRFCFNGIYRTNNAGVFNVPYGGDKTGRLPPKEVFLRCSSLLRKAELLSGDFEKILRKNVRRGDFVYLDPPYAISNRRTHTQYNAQSFGLADLERLASTVDWLANKGATFVLSYADCREARALFRHWPKTTVVAQRNVAGFVNFRRKDRELIVSNCAEPKAN
jgi:DNA adenine methylase